MLRDIVNWLLMDDTYDIDNNFSTSSFFNSHTPITEYIPEPIPTEDVDTNTNTNNNNNNTSVDVNASNLNESSQIQTTVDHSSTNADTENDIRK